MRKISIGLIGSGYIGKTHAVAYKAHQTIFGGDATPKCTAIAEVSQDLANSAAENLGFERATADWQTLLTSNDIDVIAIATPNALHKEMAIAAINAGKHVYIEKPLALDSKEANEIAAALNGRSTVHMLGYNYLCNPMIGVAKEMIDSGELGEILYFKGNHSEDYMADPNTAFNWRCSKASAGTGALGDLGSHIISIANYLVGPIASLCADKETVITHRKTPDGTLRAVENEDQTQAILRFREGTMGFIETSRVALGKKLGLGFEIVGSKGSIKFNQERMNELRYYNGSAPSGRRGFKTLLVDTKHPDFAAFCPAPGHGLGYNDLKIIEVDRLMKAIANGKPVPVDIHKACEIERVLDTWIESAEVRAWRDIR